MKKLISDLMASFRNDGSGYSAKKLSAFAIMICICVGHGKLYASEHWNQLFVSVLTVDLAFICAVFGINVADKSINK